MTEYLPGMETERRKPELSQWYTPPDLARRIAEWAVESWDKARDMRVLEPTAGRGALVDALLEQDCVEIIDAIELDDQNYEHLKRRYAGNPRVRVFQGDFLQIRPHELPHDVYDLAVQNTPFEAGQTEAFITHSLRMCERVVAHGPLTTLAGQDRKRSLWDQVSLPRMVIHSARPSYGDGGGKTDMATFDIVPELQDGVQTQIEWWA